MIERLGAPVFGVFMAVAGVAVGSGVSPTIWHFLGYSFEAASMCAALGAAFITRAIIGMRGRTIGRPLDWLVLCLVLLFVAVAVASSDAGLLLGLLYGTGLAAIGESLILLAEKWAHGALHKLGIPPASPDDPAAIERAMGRLNDIPERKDIP